MNKNPYLQKASETIPTRQDYSRLSTGTVGGVGTGIVVGSTLLQATSGATGTVVGVHVVSGGFKLDLNPIAGTFDTTHVVTATNPDTTTNTFTPIESVYSVWNLDNPVSTYFFVGDILLGDVSGAVGFVAVFIDNENCTLNVSGGGSPAQARFNTALQQLEVAGLQVTTTNLNLQYLLEQARA